MELPPRARDWTIPATATEPLTEEHQTVLLYAHTGTATVDAAGQEHHLSTGDAIWVPPGVPHRTRCRAGGVVIPVFPRTSELPAGLSTVRTITFPPGWADWLVMRHVDDMHLQHDVRETLPGAEALMGLVAGAPEGLGDRRIDAEALPMPLSREAARVARTLLRDPASSASAVSLAGRENISVKTLQRQFRHETGLAFSDWRTRARVVAAAKHLQRGHDVGSTGRRVGYATAAGFSKAFSRHTGITPSEYARHARRRPAAAAVPVEDVLRPIAALASDDALVAPPIPARRVWTRVNEEHCLLWIYRGEADVRVGARDFRLRRGDVLWLPAGVPNTVECPAGSIAMPLGLGFGSVDLDPEALSVFSFPPEAETFLLHTSMVNFTLAETATRGPSLSTELFRVQFLAGRGADTGLTRAVGSITRALRRNPADSRSLARWAEQLGTSPRELGQEFLRQTGETFPRWRAQHRMDMARWFLRLGDSPGQVARQLGYASSAAFANAFSTAHGMSPREHQRRAGETTPVPAVDAPGHHPS